MSLLFVLLAPGFLIFTYAINFIWRIQARLCKIRCLNQGDSSRVYREIRPTDAVWKESPENFPPLPRIDRPLGKRVVADRKNYSNTLRIDKALLNLSSMKSDESSSSKTPTCNSLRIDKALLTISPMKSDESSSSKTPTCNSLRIDNALLTLSSMKSDESSRSKTSTCSRLRINNALLTLSTRSDESSSSKTPPCSSSSACCRINSTSQKPILVLDLDETLIHTVMDRSQIMMNPDSFVPLTIPECGTKIWISVRPGYTEFVEALSKDYELVLWTAGVQDYAQTVLAYIDPTGLFKHRLYRQHCTFVKSDISGGYFVKDLSRLQCNMDKVTIVDNNPLSFELHPDKGIQVADYIGSADDDVLVKMKEYLRLDTSSTTSCCPNINLTSVTDSMDDNVLVCICDVADDKDSSTADAIVTERTEVETISKPCRKKPKKRSSKVFLVPTRRSERIARKNPRRSPRLLAQKPKVGSK